MADYSDAEIDDQSPGRLSSDHNSSPNMRLYGDVEAGTRAAYGPSIAQRVYDIPAGRWCYYEAPEPFPSPASADTRPPHSGVITHHQIIHTRVPTIAVEPPSLEGSAELLYVDAAGDPAPIQRTLRVPMSEFVSELEAGGTFGWKLLGNGDYGLGLAHVPIWMRDAASLSQEVAVYIEIPLPSGAQLVHVRAQVHVWGDQHDPPNWAQLSVGQTAREGDTLFHRTAESATPKPNSTGNHIIVITRAGDLPWLAPFESADKLLLIRLTGLGMIGMHWVEVTYLDPGPRNAGAA